jgi:hypothetical protein
MFFLTKKEMKDADVCQIISGTFLHPSFPSSEAQKHRFFLRSEPQKCHMKNTAHISRYDVSFLFLGLIFAIRTRGNEGVCFCGQFLYDFFSCLLENIKMDFLLTDTNIDGSFSM